jgi:hypothetical protein
MTIDGKNVYIIAAELRVKTWPDTTNRTSAFVHLLEGPASQVRRGRWMIHCNSMRMTSMPS